MIAITPKSEDKYVLKVFNWSEVPLSEMTYKIHTLAQISLAQSAKEYTKKSFRHLKTVFMFT